MQRTIINTALGILLSFSGVMLLVTEEGQAKEMTIVPERMEIERELHLSPAAESRDPKWRGSQSAVRGCTGVDLVVTSVKITRYPDRGKIGIHAKIKNRCTGYTSENIRVVFRRWPGSPHTWIRGGLGRGQTKGTGLVIDDNTNHNQAVGPVTIVVNPNHHLEISERDYSNNECTGTRLEATDTIAENHCT